MPTAKEVLWSANENWKLGLLERARDGYLQVLELDPGCWSAAFQLASMDAAFGPIDDTRLAALARPDLPDDAALELERLRRRVQRLREGVGETVLPGSLEDWDVDTLKRAHGAGDARFWEEKARLAMEVLQPGLADAYFEEASTLAPGRYFKEPKNMRDAWSDVDTRIKSLDEVEASGE